MGGAANWKGLLASFGIALQARTMAHHSNLGCRVQACYKAACNSGKSGCYALRLRCSMVLSTTRLPLASAWSTSPSDILPSLPLILQPCLRSAGVLSRRGGWAHFSALLLPHQPASAGGKDLLLTSLLGPCWSFWESSPSLQLVAGLIGYTKAKSGEIQLGYYEALLDKSTQQRFIADWWAHNIIFSRIFRRLGRLRVASTLEA
jgi:hypothetical protein